MGIRPTLPPEAEVAVEKARAAIFDAAHKNFDLLFHPILPGLNLFASVGFALPSASTLDVPVQRMRATLKQQLRDYSGSLFDAEAKERRKQASHTEELRLWLDDLAVDIEAEVTKIVVKEQLNVHCQMAVRAQAVKDGLRDRIKYWVDLKAKEIQPVIPRALPLESAATRVDWAARVIAGQIAAPVDPPKVDPPKHDEGPIATKQKAPAATFPRRASWLSDRLRERAWDHNDPWRHSGPERKTIDKILAGKRVREDVLEKLTIAHSTKYSKVELLDIPRD